MFARPLLRADVRVYFKSLSPDHVEKIRWELVAHSRTDFLVPYRFLEIDRVNHSSCGARYVRVPHWWSSLECCRVILVYFPSFLTYLGSVIIRDPGSDLWIKSVTDWVSKFSSLLFSDLYNTVLIRYVPLFVCENILSLDLSVVLILDYNYH